MPNRNIIYLLQYVMILSVAAAQNRATLRQAKIRLPVTKKHRAPAVICPGQTLPTVFSRARGWISACDKTVVCDLKRSTSERTKGRIEAEVTNTGASPSRAACSKRSRTTVMNSDSFEGCI